MRVPRGFNSIVVLVTGIAIGALLMSPVGAHVGDSIGHLWKKHIRPLVENDFYTKTQANKRFLKKSSTRTGFFSCPSTAWYPDEHDDTYWTSGLGKRYSTTSPVSSFYCNAALPHGAKVASVRFSLHDAVSPDFVGCSLLRTDLETHDATQMAVVSTDAPVGDSIQTADDIVQPKIDNNNYTYAFECVIFGDDDDLGFYGASAEYRLKATAGAAN